MVRSTNGNVRREMALKGIVKRSRTAIFVYVPYIICCVQESVQVRIQEVGLENKIGFSSASARHVAELNAQQLASSRW